MLWAYGPYFRIKYVLVPRILDLHFGGGGIERHTPLHLGPIP